MLPRGEIVRNDTFAVGAEALALPAIASKKRKILSRLPWLVALELPLIASQRKNDEEFDFDRWS